MADVLHRRARKRRAEFAKYAFARCTVFAVHPNLYELVRVERSIDFGQHCSGEAFVADAGDGMQGMGPGA